MLFEWRIQGIERDLQGKASSHEVASLRSYVDRLEHSLRESRSEVAGLRHELEAYAQRAEQLERLIAAAQEGK